MMTANQIAEFGEALANQAIENAKEIGVSPRELLISLVMAERMLQRVLFEDTADSRNAVMEGHATFDALTVVQAEN